MPDIEANREKSNPMNNPFQYTRGIRFQADPKRQGELFKKKGQINNLYDGSEKNSSKVNAYLSDLSNRLLDLSCDLKDLFYDQLTNSHSTTQKLQQSHQEPINPQQKSIKSNSSNGKCPTFSSLMFSKKLFIKQSWLKKEWHRDLFYPWIKGSDQTEGNVLSAKNHRVQDERHNDQRQQDLIGKTKWRKSQWIGDREGRNQRARNQGHRHQGSKNQGKYPLRDLKFLHPVLEQKLTEWYRHSKAIKEAKARHSDIAEHLRALLNRGMWNYFDELLDSINTQDPSLDEKIINLKRLFEPAKISKDIELSNKTEDQTVDQIAKESDQKTLYELLKSAEEFYLSNQSSGIEVCKASFNYYTLNKKSKQYYDEKLKDKKADLCFPSYYLPEHSASKGATDNKITLPKDAKNYHSNRPEDKQEDMRTGVESVKRSEEELEVVDTSSQPSQITPLSKTQIRRPFSIIYKSDSYQWEDIDTNCFFEFKTDLEKSWIENHLTKFKRNSQQDFVLKPQQTSRLVNDFNAKFKDKLKNLKKTKIPSVIHKYKNSIYVWQERRTIFTFKSDQEKLWLKRYYERSQQKDDKIQLIKGDLEQGLELSLDQTYRMMKAFKAEQRSIFYKIMTHIASDKKQNYEVTNSNHLLGPSNSEDHNTQTKNKGWTLDYKQLNRKGISQEFSLFAFQSCSDLKKQDRGWKSTLYQFLNNQSKNLNKQIKNSHHQPNINTKKSSDKISYTPEDVYNCFLDLNRKIKQQNQQKQKKSEIKTLAQQRGKFLFGKQGYFKEYGNFCKTYRQIAQKKGQLKAQIKGIEREKQETLQTDFWGMIFCEKGEKQLWLIPKEKRRDAKCFLEKGTDKLTEDQISKNINTENLQIAKNEMDKKLLRQKMKTASAYSGDISSDTNRETSHFQNFSSNDSNIGTNSTDPSYVCIFKSLTMRALHKLCFADQSSFVEELPQTLKKLQRDAQQIKTDGDPQKIQQKAQNQLKYLKSVLKSDYANQRLDLKDFDLEPALNAPDLKVFETELERACYYVKPIKLNEREKLKFIRKFDVTVLKLDSYDLKGRHQNTHQTPESPARLHTLWWKDFWSSDPSTFGKIRLNPEIKIRFRQADKYFKNYFEKRFSNQFKHRRLQDQWTACFTIALHSEGRHEELAFTKPEKLLEKINDFNHDFNQKMNFETSWKYGIDRGNKELATLCLVRFNPDEKNHTLTEDNSIQQGNLPSIDGTDRGTKTFPLPKFFSNAKYLVLKDYSYFKKYESKSELGKIKKYYAIHNPSYFMEEKYLNDKNLFEQKNLACLDLTTAKVIKGHIVENGDVMTYLKLKKAVAKRKLFKLYREDKKISNTQNLEWSKNIDGSPYKESLDGVLNIKLSNIEKDIKKEADTETGKETRKETGTVQTIYRYCKKYEGIPIKKKDGTVYYYTKDNIKNSLQAYLDSLKNGNLKKKAENHTPSILQINHLRDALVANMLGVICFLQKTYPGFVILEDLKEYTINKHFFDSEENISRRLENALYSKFQTLGHVPPHVKDIIRLREDIRDRQKDQKNKKQDSKKSDEPKKSYQQKEPSSSFNPLPLDGLSIENKQTEKGNATEEQKIKSSQIGALVFVDEQDTSKTCPYCGRKPENKKQTSSPLCSQSRRDDLANGESDKKNKTSTDDNKKFNSKNIKFRQGRFICVHCDCGFDTYFFKPKQEWVDSPSPPVDLSKMEKFKNNLKQKDLEQLRYLDDNDKVASYNIAKKIIDPEQIGKLKL